MKKVITALLTPFFQDGTVHEEGLREIVRYNIDEMKVDGLYVGGSTGESFLLDEGTKSNIFRIVKEEAGNDVMLIAQIGSLNIDEAVRLGRKCKELGYDTLSAITPYYYKFSFEEIKSYYERLTKETEMPMLLYSIPAFTGSQISINNYEKLLAIPHVIGVKYSDTDVVKLGQLKELHPDKVFYSGCDDMLFEFAVSGADGAIGSTYHLIGQEAKQIYGEVARGNVAEAQKLQLQMNKVIDKLVEFGVYQTIKYVLKKLNINSGYMRFPFRELTEEEKKSADSILPLLRASQ
ncbi:N-acetylneuraminate lyase [Evansella vedderi]|uniref:N-acetylneuraminate lyase n=1 Tax=Evansella vedderi TaxID=38282 RepID=A0ABT9ZXD6_9BACI|nr:N-acetylneuraminate lyase [Evansella vedderi]MDQ0255889.1 N-acetylneuraminate lyase [Evansella vedderi]